VAIALGYQLMSVERHRFHMRVISVLRSCAVLASLKTRSLLRFSHHQESSLISSSLYSGSSTVAANFDSKDVLRRHSWLLATRLLRGSQSLTLGIDVTKPSLNMGEKMRLLAVRATQRCDVARQVRKALRVQLHTSIDHIAGSRTYKLQNAHRYIPYSPCSYSARREATRRLASARQICRQDVTEILRNHSVKLPQAMRHDRKETRRICTRPSHCILEFGEIGKQNLDTGVDQLQQEGPVAGETVFRHV
jgi:hypothetical protein